MGVRVVDARTGAHPAPVPAGPAHGGPPEAGGRAAAAAAAGDGTRGERTSAWAPRPGIPGPANCTPRRWQVLTEGNQDSVELANKLLASAIEIEPDYAPARAEYAWTLAELGVTKALSQGRYRGGPGPTSARASRRRRRPSLWIPARPRPTGPWAPSCCAWATWRAPAGWPSRRCASIRPTTRPTTCWRTSSRDWTARRTIRPPAATSRRPSASSRRLAGPPPVRRAAPERR